MDKIMDKLPFPKLPKRLKALRISKGIKREQFLKEIGISATSLTYYETGMRTPSLDVLQRIATTYKVSLDWLCGLPSDEVEIKVLSDIASFLYALEDTEGIRFEIERDKKYASITFNYDIENHDYPINSSIYNLLRDIAQDRYEFESYMIGKEGYDKLREKIIEYYSNVPLTKKVYEELDRETRHKKHLEIMKKANQEVEEK